jgi:uncharacterized protein YndB with AHSA1/START domain
VPDNQLEFPLHVDLPPVIVWDALVDEDLVEGWLGRAEIDARVGGRYDIHWRSGGELAPVHGVITRFEPITQLRIDTGPDHFIDFSLTGLPGGSRQTSTRLVVRLSVPADPRMLGSSIANWRSNLDQLEELLRGHPVVWETWSEVRGPVWSGYLREAEDASG